MKSEILRMLKECSGHLSGQELSEHFNVSRTAVWKAIEQLKKEGHEIEGVKNKGYHLIQKGDILSKAELESQLAMGEKAISVHFFNEVDSTNTIGKKLAEEDKEKEMTLIVADSQIQGKGRRGRSWDSPKKSNIYMSLLLYPSFSPDLAPMLTHVMAISVAEGIEAVTSLSTKIKWPNDIIVEKKKVCGILTEMSAQVDYINYVVVGVGINVNQKDFPEEIKEKATSLALSGGEEVKRSLLIARILEGFEKNYRIFLETKDLSKLRNVYEKHLINIGEKVRIIEGDHGYVATGLGISDQGELKIRKEDGTFANIYAGEVSVRGVYGYV